MYVPVQFDAGDAALVDETIDANPFATLVSQVDGEPFATHLPLLRERRGDTKTVLLGHFARANPHWRAFAAGEQTTGLPAAGAGGAVSPALAIFHGPHGYISPRWYRSPNLVPTWNYAAIHCSGRLRIIEDRDEVRALIHKLVDRFESTRPDPWTPALAPELEAGLLGAIVAFEFEVERTEAKFKLSQNRSPKDRQAMLDAMAAEPGYDELLRLSARVLGGDAAAPQPEPAGRRRTGGSK